MGNRRTRRRKNKRRKTNLYRGGSDLSMLSMEELKQKLKIDDGVDQNEFNNVVVEKLVELKEKLVELEEKLLSFTINDPPGRNLDEVLR